VKYDTACKYFCGRQLFLTTFFKTYSGHVRSPWRVIEIGKFKLGPCFARLGSVTSRSLFNPFEPEPTKCQRSSVQPHRAGTRIAQ
jgi:hypothetical protein